MGAAYVIIGLAWCGEACRACSRRRLPLREWSTPFAKSLAGASSHHNTSAQQSVLTPRCHRWDPVSNWCTPRWDMELLISHFTDRLNFGVQMDILPLVQIPEMKNFNARSQQLSPTSVVCTCSSVCAAASSTTEHCTTLATVPWRPSHRQQPRRLRASSDSPLHSAVKSRPARYEPVT